MPDEGYVKYYFPPADAFGYMRHVTQIKYRYFCTTLTLPNIASIGNVGQC